SRCEHSRRADGWGLVHAPALLESDDRGATATRYRREESTLGRRVVDGYFRQERGHHSRLCDERFQERRVLRKIRSRQQSGTGHRSRDDLLAFLLRAWLPRP